MKYFLYLFLFIVIACNTNNKQDTKGVTDPPFWNDIQNFKKQDSINPPPQHAILFIGSSSFTKWTDVQNYFPDYKIINRGFGGSTLLDQIRYVNDIVFPYNPKQIVIYCGENDLASSDTVTAETVFARFITLFKMIDQKTDDVPIAYISLKPSPSRRNLIPMMIQANKLIKDYIEFQNGSLAGKRVSTYIDVFSKMQNGSGQPMPEIFLEDSLHMNAKGYAIWQKEIQPYLLKD